MSSPCCPTDGHCLRDVKSLWRGQRACIFMEEWGSGAGPNTCRVFHIFPVVFPAVSSLPLSRSDPFQISHEFGFTLWKEKSNANGSVTNIQRVIIMPLQRLYLFERHSNPMPENILGWMCLDMRRVGCSPASSYLCPRAVCRTQRLGRQMGWQRIY